VPMQYHAMSVAVDYTTETEHQPAGCELPAGLFIVDTCSGRDLIATDGAERRETQAANRLLLCTAKGKVSARCTLPISNAVLHEKASLYLLKDTPFGAVSWKKVCEDVLRLCGACQR
jgi:hypothetical protein